MGEGNFGCGIDSGQSQGIQKSSSVLVAGTDSGQQNVVSRISSISSLQASVLLG
ncbi:hypothetical protein [Bacillus alkalisoli]|uniref:hypothetical protein n=1 Tax=Bacillus alkalisoli TaxID=2011008 RepID=UPI001D0D111D|nr:hypothetical protein [Bacillus alkalisoli]